VKEVSECLSEEVEKRGFLHPLLPDTLPATRFFLLVLSQAQAAEDALIPAASSQARGPAGRGMELAPKQFGAVRSRIPTLV